MACIDPGIVPGAYRLDDSSLDTLHQPGAEVTYKCAAEYTHNGGNLTRRCNNDETWSGISPVCTINVPDDDTTRTLLIAAGSVVLACIVCIILCRIDFYFYKKRKWRGKTIRTLGMVKDGEIRPTSFIISQANQKLMPFYMSSYYKEPDTGAADKHALKQTLDSDISKILGTTKSVRKAKGSFKKKKLKAKTAKTTSNTDGDQSDVCIPTVDHLLQAATHVSVTQSLPPAKRKTKKKKKHQVEPIDDSDVAQALSLSFNGKLPVMGHSLDSYMTPEREIPRRASKYEVTQPEQQHIVPDVEIRPCPVPRARPLPPRPPTEPQDADTNGLSQQEDELVTMVDETVTKM